MQNTVTATNGGGVGIGVKLYHRMLFVFFVSFNASTTYREKCEFFAQCTQKYVSVVRVFFWASLPRGQTITLFTPKPFLLHDTDMHSAYWIRQRGWVSVRASFVSKRQNLS